MCIKPQLRSIDVLSEKLSSDHCPITMCISLQHDKTMTAGSDIEFFSKFSFNPDIFNETMRSDESLLSTYYIVNSVDFYNNWYSFLTSAVQASTQRKRNKRRNLPFLFSSHSVRISNQIETKKRRLVQIGDETSMKLLTLQEDISQSIELDKICLFLLLILLALMILSNYLKSSLGFCLYLPRFTLATPRPQMTRLKQDCSMSFYHLFIRKTGLSLPLPQMVEIAIFILTSFVSH